MGREALPVVDLRHVQARRRNILEGVNLPKKGQCLLVVPDGSTGFAQDIVGFAQVAQDSALAVAVTDLPQDRQRLLIVAAGPAGIPSFTASVPQNAQG